MQLFYSFLFLAAGLVTLLGALMNWSWFMKHRKARFVVRILGNQGTRMLYILIGLVIVIFGILGLAGVVDLR